MPHTWHCFEALKCKVNVFEILAWITHAKKAEFETGFDTFFQSTLFAHSCQTCVELCSSVQLELIFSPIPECSFQPKGLILSTSCHKT